MEVTALSKPMLDTGVVVTSVPSTGADPSTGEHGRGLTIRSASSGCAEPAKTADPQAPGRSVAAVSWEGGSSLEECGDEIAAQATAVLDAGVDNLAEPAATGVHDREHNTRPVQVGCTEPATAVESLAPGCCPSSVAMRRLPGSSPEQSLASAMSGSRETMLLSAVVSWPCCVT